MNRTDPKKIIQNNDFYYFSKNWEIFIGALSKNLDESEIEAWVHSLKLEDFRKDQITIGGLNRFFCNWISNRHKDLIKSSLFYSFKEKGLKEQFDLVLNIKKEKSKKVAAKSGKNNENGLIPQFTFDNFVNGNNTDIAYAAARSVAENVENGKYNPLFLCGGVGLGKTHLMQSIGLEVMKTNSDKKIYYCTSEQFTNEVIDGIRFQKIHRCREKYRNLDLLMIDDIQFLENKESTQTEFFHTFNELINNGKQIVITSDRYPMELTKIEERLSSRFSSGMIAKIETPDYETRIAIIETLLNQMNFSLSRDVVLHTAHTIRSNVRNIKSFLLMLEAEYSLLNQEITIDCARSILKEKLNLDRSPKSVDEIIKRVAQQLKVKVSDVMSDSREREISQARQICMHITREITDLSYPAIGKHFDKNHSSVLQACRKIKNLTDENAEIKQLVSGLIREISS